ncbi:glycoside hydrolase family 43 protein [Paenibacillus vulneris]|uniref:Glycoside hydrolase family 43 protein n=1 Tax=Paenibacillus vulneris TaxID=1133364 RepID=A0ABW3UPH3_9BACL
MSRTFHPLLLQGADPWLYQHEGRYYFMVTRGNRLDLWESNTISGISEAAPVTIWTPPKQGANCQHIWAPEIHYIRGKWYIYYTANDGKVGKAGDASRRIFVLENSSPDPMKGTWTDKGQLDTAYPGLDGTVLEHRGELYFIYSGYGCYPDYGSAIYIVKLSNPWTLVEDNVLLSAPTEPWEKQGGMAINEGPVILRKGDKLYLLFSASACWSDDYCLGMLTASASADLMRPESWIKSPGPIFAKSVENGVFGPGHNSFTKSPDGTEDWIIYHAIDISGGGAQRRSTRAQRFTWDGNGIPDFGVPVSTDTELIVPSGE